MNAIIRYLQNNRGQSVVEFALVLPIILLLLGGMIDFGRVFHEYLVVTAAAREGARSAAVGSDTAMVISTAKQAAGNKGQLTVNVTPNSRIRGESVTVAVANKVTIITPLISAFFPQNPYPVTGTAIMRVE